MIQQNVSDQTTEAKLHPIWNQRQDTTGQEQKIEFFKYRNNQDIKFL